MNRKLPKGNEDFLLPTYLRYLLHCMALLSMACPFLGVASAEDHGVHTDWIRIGQSRYGWQWLAERYDTNSDGKVELDEIPLARAVFSRLDRTWDNRLTEEDFDWSKEGVLCKQKETTFALFKMADKNSDGRLTAAEWQAVFASDTKEFLNEEELERLIYLPRIQKNANEEKLRLGNSEFSPSKLHPQDQAPKPGDLAPDFELRSPDARSRVRLSSFRGKKPVVLVFGCFTCGNYRTYSESMEVMYRDWKAEVEFLRVYVREAHPANESQAATSTNATAGILHPQPTTFAERCDLATKFTSAMRISTPLVVDELDNRVGQSYEAWPDRLYLVDRKGHIAFAGGPGPFGFNPRELEQSVALMMLEEKTNEGETP